jgi:fermentation-respiration switch protein FrsA (DUF1100 family)
VRRHRDEANEKIKKFTLEGVTKKLECPLLVMHGEDDQQVPVEDARRLHEEAGSENKTLKIIKKGDMATNTVSSTTTVS